jgi:hypothetical protein
MNQRVLTEVCPWKLSPARTVEHIKIALLRSSV